MRKVIVGSFVGFVLAAAFLAACGSGGTGGVSAQAIDTLSAQVADLQRDVAALQHDLAQARTDLTDHVGNPDAHHTPASGAATPWLGLQWCIALQGTFPSRNLEMPGDAGTALANEPQLGSIALFGGNFVPRGWAACEGQLLQINQNESLFSLLGTTFGGDGRITFGLPDLRGRTPVGIGTGQGLDPVTWGQKSP